MGRRRHLQAEERGLSRSNPASTLMSDLSERGDVFLMFPGLSPLPQPQRGL